MGARDAVLAVAFLAVGIGVQLSGRVNRLLGDLITLGSLIAFAWVAFTSDLIRAYSNAQGIFPALVAVAVQHPLRISLLVGASVAGITVVGGRVWRHTRANRLALVPVAHVEVRVPSRPNRAKENWLEWLHLEAEAIGANAPDAVVSAKIEDQTYHLRWPTDEGPREMRTLYVGRPAYIPLVLRYHSETLMGTSVGATNIRVDSCYVTDDQFLIHHNPSSVLPNGRRYRVRIEICRGDGHVFAESFWLDVPAPGGEMMLAREQDSSPIHPQIRELRERLEHAAARGNGLLATVTGSVSQLGTGVNPAVIEAIERWGTEVYTHLILSRPADAADFLPLQFRPGAPAPSPGDRLIDGVLIPPVPEVEAFLRRRLAAIGRILRELEGQQPSPAQDLGILLDVLKSYRTETSNVHISFASMPQKPLTDRLSAVFELASWHASVANVALDSYRHQYFAGVEISGYNTHLVETVAEAMRKSGIPHVRSVILQSQIQRENPKWESVQNRINVIVGHAPER